MRREALDWLRELREGAERREARALGTSLAGLDEAMRLQVVSQEGWRLGVAGAAELGLAAGRLVWAGEEVARRARQVEETRARARASRAAAEGLRRIVASRAEARQREASRRREAAEGDDRLQAWARRGEGAPAVRALESRSRP